MKLRTEGLRCFDQNRKRSSQIRELGSRYTICVEKKMAFVLGNDTLYLSQIVVRAVINKFTLLIDFASYYIRE